MTTGTVYLVGGGPGDPGLLTLRGRACMEQADVVVYDALVNTALLALAPTAEHIFVGKQRGRHNLPQEDIHAILEAQAGKHAYVVRLKGGDPFVFGRGGEEAEYLQARGIRFEVVPGVTAGIAAPAYAGIPVTHRGLAAGVTLLTAHRPPDAAPVPLAERLAQTTLCFYMGVTTLDDVVAQVRELGRAGTTPAAVVEWGTYARQRTIVGALEDLPRLCREAEVAAPAVVIVGEVVSLREHLTWFETRPLFGVRVMVTHSGRAEDPLIDGLRAHGADVLHVPTVTVDAEAEPDPPPRPIPDFDWIVLTSVNAVKTLMHALDSDGLDARALAGVRLCAVGRQAAEWLACHTLKPDANPEPGNAAVVVVAMGPLTGKRVLLPRSDLARRDLGDALRDAGAAVDVWTAYHVGPPRRPPNLDRVASFDPQVVAFTNASAARNLAGLLDAPARTRLNANAVFASIGPVTTRAAAACGFAVSIEPGQHDIASLIEAICAWRSL